MVGEVRSSEVQALLRRLMKINLNLRGHQRIQEICKWPAREKSSPSDLIDKLQPNTFNLTRKLRSAVGSFIETLSAICRALAMTKRALHRVLMMMSS
jgi:hypothetical protein